MAMIVNGVKVCPTKVIVQGGGGDSGGAYLIKVIDYDGTVLKQDHLNTGDTFELPEPPTTHERLTFQTWSSPLQITNNTITVGKSDVTIGAVYTTKSGKNEYVIELTPITGLTISGIGNYGSTIDWGDGNSQTARMQISHTYSDYGKYTITCTSQIQINNVNSAKAFVGMYLGYVPRDISQFGSTYIKEVSFPNSLITTSRCNLQSLSLKSFIIPPSCTNPNLPYGINLNSYNIEDIVIPYGVTSFTGNYLFYAVYSSLKVTFPSTITSITQFFDIITDSSRTRSYNIEELNFTEHTSVPTLGNSEGSFAFPRLKIRVPKSLESQWKSATNWSVYADYIVGVE